MRYLISLLVFWGVGSYANKPVWEMKTGFKEPESVYYDKKSKMIFVSNVEGAPMNKDGKGAIHEISIDGKMVKENWVSGLDAPKGMRSKKGVLWVTNIDEVVSIDIKTAKILQRIKVPGAKFLNDLEITRKGVVFVSDTIGNKIYRIKKGKPTVFVEGKNLESPNGLLLKKGKLYVGSWGTEMDGDWNVKQLGRIYVINLKNKKQTFISKAPLGNLDGLEFDKKGNFIVSDWKNGKVFSVTKDGTAKEILSGFKGSADIAVIKKKGLLLIPRMGENIVSAHKL